MHKQGEIAECAYFIWERKGCPEGKALECWLEAETEIKAADLVRKHMHKAAAARQTHRRLYKS
jgi:hypothetical protein